MQAASTPLALAAAVGYHIASHLWWVTPLRARYAGDIALLVSPADAESAQLQAFASEQRVLFAFFVLYMAGYLDDDIPYDFDVNYEPLEIAIVRFKHAHRRLRAAHPGLLPELGGCMEREVHTFLRRVQTIKEMGHPMPEYDEIWEDIQNHGRPRGKWLFQTMLQLTYHGPRSW